MSETFTSSAPYHSEEGEDYMNDQQKAHFRAILLAWKHDLMEESRRTGNTISWKRAGALSIPCKTNP